MYSGGFFSMYTKNMSALSFLEYKLNSSKANKTRYMYLCCSSSYIVGAHRSTV